MWKTILAAVWILAIIAVTTLGLNGGIDPTAMTVLSLAALTAIYGLALHDAIVNMRDVSGDRGV